ncbi:hypothetical protein [Actinoplanes couchii]|uniref:Uncharacterized protein n=1 Tax=Actinoplanes couchii TaxID=403638 RepID=A0ABQ3X028_9ACTN|nr:hypothetical protein [Actinoplanes couchii]MDR6316188.1 hypothetical protein [Actinoplanes couchii]GID51803.1 hypothetical protein Aco03nite_002070 [Actinoplanes couchii]
MRSVAGRMELTPGQQERIRGLLEEALREAGRAALEKHDAAAVSDFITDRRRALEQMSAGPHDPEDVLDQDGEGGGVGEQR